MGEVLKFPELKVEIMCDQLKEGEWVVQRQGDLVVLFVPHNRKVIAFGFNKEQAVKLALKLAGEASK